MLGQVAATFREQALANQWRHVPGSPIEGLWRSRTDLQGEWGDEPLQSAFYSAVLTSVCVLEHLEAVADCYQREPFRRFPALSLARSLTEGAARVAYALSPNIGADDLVTRGLNDQLYAMREDDAVIKGIVTNPRLALTWRRAAGKSRTGPTWKTASSPRWIEGRGRSRATGLVRSGWVLSLGQLQ